MSRRKRSINKERVEEARKYRGIGQIAGAIIVWLALVFFCLCYAAFAHADTLTLGASWENPTTYTDGTTISDLEKADLITYVYECSDVSCAAYTSKVTATGGASSAQFNTTYAAGETKFYFAKSELYTQVSEASATVAYTYAGPPPPPIYIPRPPVLIEIIKVGP